MKVALWLFLAFAIVFTGLHTNPAPAIRRVQSQPRQMTTFFVSYDINFPTRDRNIIENSLSEYKQFGIRFVATNASSVDLHIMSWFNLLTVRIGEFHPDTAVVLIDNMKIESEEQLRATAIHEVGHFLGMRHICEYVDEDVDCSPVGYGLAIMNPTLYPNHITHFSELDMAEFRRARSISVPHIL